MSLPRKWCANGCGKPVTGRRPEAIYCSNACNVAACKRRKAFAALAGRETGQKPIEEAIAKLKPTARRIVRGLEAAPRHSATTYELSQRTVGGLRFSARIFEIREALAPHGITIDKSRRPDGQYVYTLRLPQLLLDVDDGVPPGATPPQGVTRLPSSRAGRDATTDPLRKAA